jgi:hypothetical protein
MKGLFAHPENATFFVATRSMSDIASRQYKMNVEHGKQHEWIIADNENI